MNVLAPRAGSRSLGPCSPPLAAGRDFVGCDRAGTPRGGDPSVFARGCATDTPPRAARSVPAASAAMAGPPEGRVSAPAHFRDNNPNTNLFGRVLSHTEGKRSAGRKTGLGRYRTWRGVAIFNPPRGRQEPSRRSVRAPSALIAVGRRRGGLTPTPRGHAASSATRARATAGRRAGLEARPERPAPSPRGKKSPRSGKTRADPLRRGRSSDRSRGRRCPGSRE